MLTKLIGLVLLVVFGLSVPILLFEFAVWQLPRGILPAIVRQQLAEIEIRSEAVNAKDPDLGYVIRPGVEIDYAWEESSFRFKTNLNYPGAGFRGGTLGGAPWGIAVGDSFTFGAGVNQSATWVALLAQLAGREMVNLGVMGYGPQQYTGTLEKFGIALHPKLVLYALFTNDLRDAQAFANRNRKRQNFSLKKYLLSHSVIYNLIHGTRRARSLDSRYIPLDEVGQMLNVRKLTREIEADRKRIATAWPIIVEQIERARQLSAAAGAKFALLYFPSKEEVYWALVKQKLPELARLDGREQQFKKVVLEYCRGSDMVCFDLTPALKAKDRVKLYFRVDSHWNASGHRAVAEAVYRFLSNAGLL